MKHLRPDLLEKYDRIVKNNPDHTGLAYPFINLTDALSAYFILADYFTDDTADAEKEAMLVEVLHIDLLQSALSRQNVSYGGKTKYREPLQICATLFYGLIKNHCFVDGNKRTALLTLLYQLDRYGYLPAVSQKAFEELTVNVAANKLEEKYSQQWRKSHRAEDYTDHCVETIRLLLKKMTRKKDNTFHIQITAQELINRINHIEWCSCCVEGGKIKFKRIIKKRVWMFKVSTIEKAWTIQYHGATRTVGAETVRDILKQLDLYEEYPTYQSFIEGADPRYMLIQTFEHPLRRLKDR